MYAKSQTNKLFFTDCLLAGDAVTVEMHQQPGDRSCADEAIGGDHWGPIIVSNSTGTQYYFMAPDFLV